MKRAFAPLTPRQIERLGLTIYGGSRRWRWQMQRDLALGPSTVWNWTNGAREPSPAAQRAILLLHRVHKLETELKRLRGVQKAARARTRRGHVAAGAADRGDSHAVVSPV